MGLRELARMNGIENHSLVMHHSTRGEWARKRAEFRERAEGRAVTLLVNDEGARRAKELRVRDNALEAIDEAITKMRDDMKRMVRRYRDGQWVEEPAVTVRPADFALLIDRLNVLFGRPSTITEERSLGLSLSASGLGTDALKAIAEATRGIADVGGAASSPIPRLDRAREN